MIRPRSVVVSAILGCALAPGLRADEPPGGLTLADLGDYPRALAEAVDPSAPPATFRDLWEHSERHRRKPVRVEGTLARSFRQPASGRFPALVEAWITNPAGDPSCLVFAEDPARPVPPVGSAVRFGGTFLRTIAYRGFDADRAAPLIVGPRPPEMIGDGSPLGGAGPGFAMPTDWTFGALAVLLVGWVVARKHLARPGRIDRPARADVEPEPTFVDGEDATTDQAPGSDR